MSCSSTDKNTQLLRQQITANYQALNAELDALAVTVAANGVQGLPTLPPANVFIGSPTSSATAQPLTGDVLIDTNGVTSIASKAIVNDDVSDTANIAPAKLALPFGQVLIGGAGNVATGQSLTGPIGISPTGATTIATGAITNAEISTSAAIDPQKVALTSGRILIGDGTGKASAQAVSGDVTLTTNGTSVTSAITSNSIVNADINTAAGITPGKLALGSGKFLIGSGGVAAETTLAPGQILVGNASSVATPLTIDGDVLISSAGVTSIKALSVVNGDISDTAGITPGKLALGSGKVYIGSSGGVAAEQSVSALSALFGVRYVKTWPELQAAMAAAATAGGGVIYIDGTIIVPPNNSAFGTGGFDISVPNIVITGPSNGSSVIKLQAGATYGGFLNFTINVNNNNITIENITIEGVNNFFLVNGVPVASVPVGIHLARNNTAIPNNPGITDTVIRNVTFSRVNLAVWQTGGGSTPINRNLTILNNSVKDCGGGFVLSYGINGLLIDGNSIIGDGAVFDGTKFSYYNAIWVGIGMSNVRVTNNYCANHQRMGIEIFYPFRNLTDVNQGPHSNSYGQNDASVIVSNNIIKNVGSMGISFAGARNSIISNNTISDCVFIGLEIVGDDRNQSSQKPDRVVGMICANNVIKNVKATPRRPYTLAPTATDYGYSAIPLNPTSIQLETSNVFSNYVPLSTPSTYAVGVKTFAFTTINSYPGFEVGTQVMLRRTDNPSLLLIGTVELNDGTSIRVNVGVNGRNGPEDLGSFLFSLCMYGVRTINVPSLPIEWSGNGGMFNSIPSGLTEQATEIYLQSTAAGEKDRFFSAYVYSYVPNATTCQIFITGSSSNSFTAKTGWIGFASKACTGMAIDQINGAKVIGNTIDTVLDSNSPERWGCQIILSENIIFENNLITRAGLRYLVINASNRVVARNNVLRSGDKLMVRQATSNNITVLGEDINYPENNFANGSTPLPSGIYAAFPANSIGHNISLPYNGCRWIVKDNTMAGLAGFNTLKTYVNGGAVSSDQFSRPETVFDSSGYTKLKHNNSTDGYDLTVDRPSPVLDYSQKWNNATSAFTAYRFHADPGASADASRIFDVAAGDESYLYLKTYGSTTSNSLALGSKTFTISSPTLTNFLLATVPANTFVRCTSGTAFIEGRVTTLVSPGSSSFTMLATNFGGTGGPYASWTIQFDTSALFVDKTSNLNLRSDVVLDYHTGTKIATAPTQKLGFWGKAPVVQRASIAAPTGGDLTSTQAKLNEVIAALRDIGVIA